MRVALVGTEGASHGLAPWDDPSWAIWSTSPMSKDYPRVDRHFEVHAPALLERTVNEKVLVPYIQHLRAHPNVWTLCKHAMLPKAKQLDHEALLDEFGPEFFSSSIAWMLAEAILTPRVKEIGLWGIDCSATDEYLVQRPGVQFFLREARKRKISVFAPPESDILRPAPIYGLREFSPLFRKTDAKERQLREMLADAEAKQVAFTEKVLALRGALEQVSYYKRTFDDHGSRYSGSED